MENLINLAMLEQSESELKGRIFTELHLSILKKRLKNKRLNSNERTYYYKFIKPKIRAMLSLFNIQELNFSSREKMIKHRVHTAVQILKKLSKKHKKKKMLLSGSFLFSEKYNDIDVFIFTKYKKEDYRKGGIYVNFLSESALDSLFFASISKISISNFSYAAQNEFSIGIDELTHQYELLINHVINKEDFKQELRDFLVKAEYFARGVVLDSKQLYTLVEKILKIRNTVGIISDTLINSLVLGCPEKVLVKNLSNSLKNYEKLLNTYKKAKNLEIYVNTYKRAIELES